MTLIRGKYEAPYMAHVILDSEKSALDPCHWCISRQSGDSIEAGTVRSIAIGLLAKCECFRDQK